MEVGIMLTINCEAASFDEQLATIARLGVKRTFVNAKFAANEEIMGKIRAAGLTCDNCHAVFNGEKDGVIFKMGDFRNEGIKGDYMLEALLQNIDNCVKGGVSIMVVHGAGSNLGEPWSDIHVERMRTLMDHAKKNNITIAFENLGNTQEFLSMFEHYPDASFCWDCGHQYCNTPEMRYMESFGHKLVALHIHDNSCEKGADQHMIPYDASINFDEVAFDIAKSGFDGTMMLEIMYGKEGSVGGGYADRMSYEEYATRACNAAKRIIERVEFFRKELAK